MTEKNKFVILFDMDGTIVDTERTAMQTLVRYFARYRHTLSVTDLAYLVGRPWANAVHFLLEQYPIAKSPTEVETELLVEYRANFALHMEVIPGVVESIRDLAKNFHLGLVSGSRRQDIETILAALNVRDQFTQVLGYEDYAKGKPSPIPYLDALKLFGITAEKALVFEDSSVGIRSALDAGIKTVTVGEAVTGTDTRPTTSWFIPDFLEVNSAWVAKKFK